MISQKELPFASYLLAWSQQTEFESGEIPIPDRLKGHFDRVWEGFSAVYYLVEGEAEVRWSSWLVVRRDCLKEWSET
jgi:hypothetical protein